MVSFKNKCIFKIVIFYVPLATSWFVITTIPVLFSVLLPKVPRSMQWVMGMKNSLIALFGKTLGGRIGDFLTNLSTEFMSE